MGENTAITWCHHTFNLWWGCWKIAQECANCYADTMAHRYESQYGKLWGRTADRRFLSEHYWNEPRRWNAKAKAAGVRERVFIGSMCDWAELHPLEAIRRKQDAARRRMWQLIRECDALDFMLLTKRPDDAEDLLPWVASREDWAGVGVDAARELIGKPWGNVWLGVSCGSVASLPLIATLRTLPAAVRFVSGEPLLEHITREQWDLALGSDPGTGKLIDMLIIGDESGPGRRPAQADWVRTAREAALAHGVAFHFKQWNGPTGGGIEGRIDGKSRKIHLPILDGKQWAEFPTITRYTEPTTEH